MSVVDEYLDALDEQSRAALEHVRRVAKDVVPELEDGRSYGMPALKYHNRPLIGFIAAKNHLSLFPFNPEIIDVLRERLDGFELAKGTIRFSAERPIPDDVLRDIVRIRLQQIS